MTRIFAFMAAGVLLLVTGCGPALVGAGAAGAVKVGVDERSVGQQWSDTSLTTQVKSALVRDTGASALKIDVDTVDRHVYLSGVVNSATEKERAGQIAQSVVGVRSVKNNLQVGSKSVGQMIDDKVIGTRVKGRLAEADSSWGIKIDVDTNRGVVSLTGVVKSAEEKQRAVGIARDTPGVADVVDNLRVTVKP